MRTIEQVRETKRKHMARKRAADPDAARQYGREWYHRNHAEQRAKRNAAYAKRFFWGRAMKLRGSDRATTKEIARLWRRQRGLCALTGRRLDRSAQLDHILPQSRGGKDDIGNLRWVCEAANIAKRHMTDDEFAALCRDVVRWIGERIQAVDALA